MAAHERQSEGPAIALATLGGTRATTLRAVGATWLRKPWVQRALILAMSLAFLHVFPTILFVVYMAEHGIFDYGFFREGPFAMGVFYGTAELLLVLASLTLFGVTVAIPGWLRTREKEWLVGGVGLLCLNIATLVSVISAIAKSDTATLGDSLVFLSFCFLLAVHLAVTLHAPPRAALMTLVLVFSATGVLTAVRPQTMTGVLGWGLSVYNVGGDVPISLADAKNPARKGKLVFLGPDRIYLRFDDESSLTILERTEQMAIKLLGKPAAPKP